MKSYELHGDYRTEEIAQEYSKLASDVQDLAVNFAAVARIPDPDKRKAFAGSLSNVLLHVVTISAAKDGIDILAYREEQDRRRG